MHRTRFRYFFSQSVHLRTTYQKLILNPILSKLNDFERGLIVVNTALLNAPQHSMLLLQKCAFLGDLGRYKESIEVLDLLQEIEKKKTSSE